MSTSMSSGDAAIADPVADEEIDESLYDEFAELPPRKRVPRLTRVLLLGILLIGSFAGGVTMQKNQGASLTSTAGAPAAGSGGGGFPGGGAGGLPGGGSAGSRGATTSTAPVLIGTVVSATGNDITVKDLGGATHAVHLAGGASIAVSTTVSADALKPGATVSVTGTKAPDGSVTATAMTAKS